MDCQRIISVLPLTKEAPRNMVPGSSGPCSPVLTSNIPHCRATGPYVCYLGQSVIISVGAPPEADPGIRLRRTFER